jgi:hypothetical protein
VKEAADEDEGSSDEHAPVREPKQLHSLSDIPSRISIAATVLKRIKSTDYDFHFPRSLQCISVVESSEADHVEYPPQ